MVGSEVSHPDLKPGFITLLLGWCASESTGGHIKTQLSRPQPRFLIRGLEWEPRIYIYNKFSGGIPAADPGTVAGAKGARAPGSRGPKQTRFSPSLLTISRGREMRGGKEERNVFQLLGTGQVNHCLGVNHGGVLLVSGQSLLLEGVVSVPILGCFSPWLFCLS